MNILVPINFCEPSLKGINYALSVADSTRDQITTIQVIAPNKPQTAKLAHKMQELQWEEDQSIHKEKLIEFLAKTSNPDFPYKEHLLRKGDPSKRVLVETLDNDYDLIIMGTKGGSKLKTTIFGSSTFNLLKMATIPALIVPGKWTDTDVDHACIALQFDNMITPICDRLINVSKSLGYRPSIMTVVKKVESEVGISLTHKNENYPIHFFENKKPTKAISKYIEDNNVSLLCLHFNIYSSISSLIYTSAAEEFSFRSPIPTLFTK